MTTTAQGQGHQQRNQEHVVNISKNNPTTAPPPNIELNNIGNEDDRCNQLVVDKIGYLDDLSIRDDPIGFCKNEPLFCRFINSGQCQDNHININGFCGYHFEKYTGFALHNFVYQGQSYLVPVYTDTRFTYTHNRILLLTFATKNQQIEIPQNSCDNYMLEYSKYLIKGYIDVPNDHRLKHVQLFVNNCSQQLKKVNYRGMLITYMDKEHHEAWKKTYRYKQVKSSLTETSINSELIQIVIPISKLCIFDILSIIHFLPLNFKTNYQGEQGPAPIENITVYNGYLQYGVGHGLNNPFVKGKIRQDPRFDIQKSGDVIDQTEMYANSREVFHSVNIGVISSIMEPSEVGHLHGYILTRGTNVIKINVSNDK